MLPCIALAIALAAPANPTVNVTDRRAILVEAQQVERDFVPRDAETIHRTSAQLLQLSRSAARLGDSSLANELKVKAAYVQLIARDERWVRFALLEVIQDDRTHPALRADARAMLAFVNRPRRDDNRSLYVPDQRSFGVSFGVNNFPEPTYPTQGR